MPQHNYDRESLTVIQVFMDNELAPAIGVVISQTEAFNARCVGTHFELAMCKEYNTSQGAIDFIKRTERIYRMERYAIRDRVLAQLDHNPFEQESPA